MTIYKYCYNLVYEFNNYLAVPATITFVITAILLTIKTKFVQIRGLKRLVKIILEGIKEKKLKNIKTISPFQALFTAMATTIGMGNIVGPSIAISLGGPSALFWLIIYIFLGSATKFTEVTFSVYARNIEQNGNIIGGPTQYLKLISPFLGKWYAALTVFLFTIWSSIQVNTISCICYIEGIEKWLVGFATVSLLLFILLGGVQRIGNWLSKLVPFMFIIYVTFALFIIFKDINKLKESILLIFECLFNKNSICSGILGASIFNALKEGVYKGIFITEAGIGTSSIAHSLADVKKPVNQGILALLAGFADIILCLLSGLITLVTGVWQNGKLTNTLVYEAFKINTPFYGQIILIISIFLFVTTSLIGNTFNGGQSFASIINYKYIKIYYIFAAIVAFFGSITQMPFLWNLMDIILVFVAIPNLIGILILSFKYKNILKF